MQRIIQAGFLFLFFLGVGLCVRPWQEWTPLAAMIRLDPLLWIGQWMSTKTVPAGILQAGTVVLITLILGRFFCSHVCPLGTSLDAVSQATGGKRRWHPPESWRRGKYIVLLVMLLAALWGQNLTHWGSPMSLATRLYALVIWPFVHFLFQPMGMSPILFGLKGEPVRVAHLHWLVVLLGFILSSAWIVPRFWCRYLCPTGAVLAVLSRGSLMTRKVQKTCTECGLCATKCPAGVATPGNIPAGECLSCRKCQSICPQGAISWLPNGGRGKQQGFFPSRRQALGAVALGTGAAWLAWGSLWSYRGEREKGQPRDAQLIRPPGAVPEVVFLNLCVRCGTCMRVCPTNMLQPQGTEQGMQGMFAPVAVSRRGPCRPECTACGEVCPTGAIRNLAWKERMWAKMGTAVIHRELCLAWEWDRGCLVCDESCPYGAIDLRRVQGNQEAVPFVLKDRCTGCGACEHACPVQGQAAIRISFQGSIRLLRGSYRIRGQQLGFSISRRQGRIIQPSGEDPAHAGPSGLPPGFGQ